MSTIVHIIGVIVAVAIAFSVVVALIAIVGMFIEWIEGVE